MMVLISGFFSSLPFCAAMFRPSPLSYRRGAAGSERKLALYSRTWILSGFDSCKHDRINSYYHPCNVFTEPWSVSGQVVFITEVSACSQFTSKMTMQMFQLLSFYNWSHWQISGEAQALTASYAVLNYVSLRRNDLILGSGPSSTSVAWSVSTPVFWFKSESESCVLPLSRSPKQPNKLRILQATGPGFAFKWVSKWYKLSSTVCVPSDRVCSSRCVFSDPGSSRYRLYAQAGCSGSHNKAWSWLHVKVVQYAPCVLQLHQCMVREEGEGQVLFRYALCCIRSSSSSRELPFQPRYQTRSAQLSLLIRSANGWGQAHSESIILNLQSGEKVWARGMRGRGSLGMLPSAIFYRSLWGCLNCSCFQGT